MKIRFLLDENLNPRVKSALLHRDPTIDVLQIGDAEALPRGTLDPDILKCLEHDQRALVTDNRKSIPGHIADHFAAGGHHWGIFMLVQTQASIGQLAEELFLLWEASEAKEWIDQRRWLPL